MRSKLNIFFILLKSIFDPINREAQDENMDELVLSDMFISFIWNARWKKIKWTNRDLL